MIQCPDCKQQIALPSDQTDNPDRCPECRSALPPKLLTPRGVKIRETPDETVICYRRSTLIRTFFYLSAIAVVIKLTAAPIRHWLAGNFVTVWEDIIFCAVAAATLGYLIFELFGSNQIRQSDSVITLFTGIGNVGRSQRLEIYDVAQIELIEPIFEKYKNRAGYLKLMLHNGRSITFFKSYDQDALQYFYVRLRQKTNLT